MSFGEYIRLLENEARWQKTELKLDRKILKRSSSQKVIADRDHTKKVFGSTSFCAVTM
jgi:hypothetical protein